MTQTIPLSDTPAQELTATLGGQTCRLRVVTRQGSLYLDLYVSDKLIVAGAIALDGVPIVRDIYLGFVGDLVFSDTQGASDPSSPGLGTRFQLLYFTPDELAAA